MARKSRPRGRSAVREDIADRLHSAAIHLLRRLRRTDAESGLTAARLSALSVLVFGGSRSLGALAEAEQVRPASMSRLVRELERDGLVRREADPDDARAIVLHATARGRRLLEQGRSRRIASLVELLATLPAGELRQLGQAAETINRLARA